MSYNDDLFDWRRHTSAPGLDEAQAAHIDLIASLARGDVGYFHWVGRHACDHFDPATMLTWAKKTGLVTGAADLRFHDDTHAVLVAGRKPFMTKDEIERRMAVADGHCPFCGDQVSFNSEKDASGRGYHVLGHCYHFRIDLTDDPERTLRSPSAWQARRWPYGFAGLEARPDGTPLRDEPYISHHCMSCRRETAIEKLRPKVVAALVDWYAQGGRDEWRGLGSSPVSALRCDATTCDCTEPCAHVMGRIERWADEIVGKEHTELRLNGAGLKLYAQGVRVSFGFHPEVTFSMRVGGDQAGHYPAFTAYAGERLVAAGLTDFTTERS